MLISTRTKKISLGILALVASIGGYEFIRGMQTRIQRKKMYQKALKRKKETGKPLLVIGDPYNGGMNSILGNDYDAGDITLDINGCPELRKRGNFNIIEGKLEDEIVKLQSNSYIVFLSCVLEYVNCENMQKVIQELHRISYNGKIEKDTDNPNLFIVTVPTFTIHSEIYFPVLWTHEGGANNVVYLKNGKYQFRKTLSRYLKQLK